MTFGKATRPRPSASPPPTCKLATTTGSGYGRPSQASATSPGYTAPRVFHRLPTSLEDAGQPLHLPTMPGTFGSTADKVSIQLGLSEYWVISGSTTSPASNGRGSLVRISRVRTVHTVPWEAQHRQMRRVDVRQPFYGLTLPALSGSLVVSASIRPVPTRPKARFSTTSGNSTPE